MKSLLFFAAASVALVVGAPGVRAQVYVAPLSGANEEPANASPGTGWVTVTYDSVAHSLRIQASFADLLGTTVAAHIHAPAAAGMNAGIATQPSLTGFPIGVTTGSVDTTLDLTLAASFRAGYITENGGTAASAEFALAQALAGGLAYFNVHTTSFPGGELRGNLASVPDGEGGVAMLVPALMGLLGVARWQQRRKLS